MGAYLRDSSIPFLTIRVEELESLNQDLEEIVKTANLKITEEELTSLSYVLRYDGMGIVRTKFGEIRKCFEVAKNVERVVFQVTTPKSYLYKGKNIEIFLDANNEGQCSIRVTDDDEAWVDNTYKHLSSRLGRYKNGNWVIHSAFANLFVQVLGVLAGTSGCLLAAKIIAPFFKVENSFLALFIGLLFVFANLWTYLLFLLNKIRILNWPFISFKKKPLGIIGQTIIGLLITSLVTWLLKSTLSLFSSAGSMIVK